MEGNCSEKPGRRLADTEIEFLERLYDKVSADMKGGQG